MKYKSGDKVKIKTWEQMILDFPNTNNMGDEIINIKNDLLFSQEMEKLCEKHNRVMTIQVTFVDGFESGEYLGETGNLVGYYYMVEDNRRWLWNDEMIEDPEKYEYEIDFVNRFELLDFGI